MPKSCASVPWPKVALGQLGGITSQKTNGGAWHGRDKPGSGAEMMNSWWQQAQIPPALGKERAGREQGEEEGGTSSCASQGGLVVPGGIGFKRQQISPSRCISYPDHGVGEGWQHIPENVGDGGLTGRFTSVHGGLAPGVGLRPLHTLERWHMKAVVDAKKPEWPSKTVHRRE